MERTGIAIDAELLRTMAAQAGEEIERLRAELLAMAGEDVNLDSGPQVAKILAELQLDSVTVATGLIHDVIEDTSMRVEDIERAFGTEIAQIVDGLTKIEAAAYHAANSLRLSA